MLTVHFSSILSYFRYSFFFQFNWYVHFCIDVVFFLTDLNTAIVWDSNEIPTRALNSGNYNLENVLKCSLCPFMSKYPSRMKQHLVVHTNDTPFQCDLCQKKFNRKDNMQKHRLLHFKSWLAFILNIAVKIL